MPPSLVTWPTRNTPCGFLGKPDQPRRALSRTWLTEPGRGGQALVHRVCTESATISRGPALDACCRIDSTPVSASALTPSSGSSRRARGRRPAPAIPRRDVQHRQFGRHLRHRLQQQGRLADARIATDQHHRALDQATAPAPGRTRRCRWRPGDARSAPRPSGRDLRRVDLAGPAGPARSRRLGRRRAFSTIPTASSRRCTRCTGPAIAEFGAAFIADVGGAGFCHRMISSNGTGVAG